MLHSFIHYHKMEQESYATVAGETMQCCCKFWYISNFTIRW